MFDPAAYFSSVELAISGCKSWAQTTGPDAVVFPDGQGGWEWCTWRFEVIFSDGHKLTAFESHAMRKRKHLRKIKYRLTKPDGTMIVQVDPHANQVPFEETPHIHIGPNQKNRVHEGDPQLGDYSLKNYDFLKMWELVERYIDGRGLPWQA